MVVFLEHMVQFMPLLPSISCFIKIQNGFTFLVPAYPGCPGIWAVKRVSVCQLVSNMADLSHPMVFADRGRRSKAEGVYPTAVFSDVRGYACLWKCDKGGE